MLPKFQRLGIGTELMKQMLMHLNGFYAIDVICDSALKLFYERLDFAEATGMKIRRTRRDAPN